MNSYNRGKKGTSWQTIDRSAELDRKSSRRIPIATLKKQSWLAMDIAAGIPRGYRHPGNRFWRQKKLANRGAGVHSNDRGKERPSEVRVRCSSGESLGWDRSLPRILQP
jgi:hypothetical protein